MKKIVVFSLILTVFSLALYGLNKRVMFLKTEFFGVNLAAEFAVDSLRVVPQTLNIGDLPVFEGLIKNSGGSTMETIMTSLKLDQGNDGTFDWNPQAMYTGPLLANQSEKEIWSGWFAVPGNHKIEVCTDATQLIREQNESDNCKTATFLVSEPQVESRSRDTTTVIPLPTSTPTQTTTPTITPTSTLPVNAVESPSRPLRDQIANTPLTEFVREISPRIETGETPQQEHLNDVDELSVVKEDARSISDVPQRVEQPAPVQIPSVEQQVDQPQRSFQDNQQRTNNVAITPKIKDKKVVREEKAQRDVSQQQQTRTTNEEIKPVCGSDGVTYQNAAAAKTKGISVTKKGICKARTSKEKPVIDPARYGKKSKKSAVRSSDKLKPKTVRPVPKKSSSTGSTAQNVDDTSFALGPEIDREIFLVTSEGSGTFSVTLNWTGTAQNLKLEVGPKQSSEKETQNIVGYKSEYVAFGASSYQDFGIDPNDAKQLADIENNNSGSTNAYVEVVEGSSPLKIENITLDTVHYKEIQIIVTNYDGQEAQGSLSFGGSGKVKTVLKKTFMPESLTKVQKIIVPIVMYQLDRKFQNLSTAEKGLLDLEFEKNLASKPLANLKLKNALYRYNALSLNKKQKLFNVQTVDILDNLKGQALTPDSIQQLSGLLREELPPTSPHDLIAATQLTDPDAEVAGIKLTLFWQHDDPYESGFEIERALVYDVIEQQVVDPGALEFQTWKTVGKTVLSGYLFQEVLSDPENYCFRVRAYNKNGKSGYSNMICPERPNLEMQYVKYNLKWTKLKAIEESDIDGASNSDEPYLIFTMINGKGDNGGVKIWTRRWTGADDVDSGETESDGGDAASFTLFGMPSAGAEEKIKELENDLRIAAGQKNTAAMFEIIKKLEEEPWGTINTHSPDVPEKIDLATGLVVNVTAMEHDDGATITLEEQIRAGIDAALDISEAVATPDPYHIAVAVKSTLEFLYSLWAADDYIGSQTWPITYWDAWSQVPPSSFGAKQQVFTIDGGSTGKYQVNFCLYPVGASASALANVCDIQSGGQ